jgi:hypothetical protein
MRERLTMEELIKMHLSESCLRPCIVGGKMAVFHRWADKAHVIPPGRTVGSHSGGQMRFLVGIVEYEDGTVCECYPYEIKFTDKEEDGEGI